MFETRRVRAVVVTLLLAMTGGVAWAVSDWPQQLRWYYFTGEAPGRYEPTAEWYLSKILRREVEPSEVRWEVREARMRDFRARCEFPSGGLPMVAVWREAQLCNTAKLDEKTFRVAAAEFRRQVDAEITLYRMRVAAHLAARMSMAVGLWMLMVGAACAALWILRGKPTAA
jgi:hypothetical protein